MTARSAPPSLAAELSATTRLAAPLALANVMAMAVHAIDIIFVARLGQDALAAANLAMAAFWFINYGLFGLVSAVAPLLSAELGRRADPVRQVRRSFRMACWLAVAGGLAGLALAFTGEAFFLATGQEPGISALAADFFLVLAFSMVPTQLATVMRVFVSVMGRPIFATMITGVAILVNALANYAFVFGNLGAPELGFLGSALSSVITSVVTMLAYVIAIQSNRRLRRYRVFGNWWRPEWRRLREIVKIGTPIGLTTMAEAGLFTGAAFLMGRIGAAELAAHTIILQIASFTFQVPNGISQAATIRVGYYYGAGNLAGITQAGRAALIVGIGFMTFAASLFVIAPKLLMSAYVDPYDPANAALIALAGQYIIIAAAFQIFDGTQAVAAGLLRGLQDTRVPMLFAISSYWLIGFSISAWLGLTTPLGGVGVWIGLAISLVAASTLLLWRWSRRASFRLVPDPSYARIFSPHTA